MDLVICSFASDAATRIGFRTPSQQQQKKGQNHIENQGLDMNASISSRDSPDKAPTAPNTSDVPSIMLASHSTWPSSVKLDPRPAFVLGSSFERKKIYMKQCRSYYHIHNSWELRCGNLENLNCCSNSRQAILRTLDEYKQNKHITSHEKKNTTLFGELLHLNFAIRNPKDLKREALIKP